MKESNQYVMRPVRPVSPAAAYIGGKRLLSARLVQMIEETPHTLYAEPFVGMGGVFLRRTQAPAAEIINDYSRDVANFFRVLQRHYGALMDMIRWHITWRFEFERLRNTDPSTLTDLERAVRFLYLQRISFGGKVAGRTFGVNPGGPARFNLGRLEPILEAVSERLHAVVIECLPWQDFTAGVNAPVQGGAD